MDTKRLEDENFSLGPAGIIQDIMRPVYKVYAFNPETDRPPATTHIDVIFNEPDTWKLLGIIHESSTPSDAVRDHDSPACRVIDVNRSGWLITQVEGDEALIKRLAAAAETMGAECLVS